MQGVSLIRCNLYGLWHGLNKYAYLQPVAAEMWGQRDNVSIISPSYANPSLPHSTVLMSPHLPRPLSQSYLPLHSTPPTSTTKNWIFIYTCRQERKGVNHSIFESVLRHYTVQKKLICIEWIAILFVFQCSFEIKTSSLYFTLHSFDANVWLLIFILVHSSWVVRPQAFFSCEWVFRTMANCNFKQI